MLWLCGCVVVVLGVCPPLWLCGGVVVWWCSCAMVGGSVVDSRVEML